MRRQQISQEEANAMHREALEKAARDARQEVRDIDRRIAELQKERAAANKNADRLTSLVVKTWGMGR